MNQFITLADFVYLLLMRCDSFLESKCFQRATNLYKASKYKYVIHEQ